MTNFPQPAELGAMMAHEMGCVTDGMSYKRKPLYTSNNLHTVTQLFGKTCCGGDASKMLCICCARCVFYYIGSGT